MFKLLFLFIYILIGLGIVWYSDSFNDEYIDYKRIFFIILLWPIMVTFPFFMLLTDNPNTLTNKILGAGNREISRYVLSIIIIVILVILLKKLL